MIALYIPSPKQSFAPKFTGIIQMTRCSKKSLICPCLIYSKQAQWWGQTRLLRPCPVIFIQLYQEILKYISLSQIIDILSASWFLNIFYTSQKLFSTYFLSYRLCNIHSLKHQPEPICPEPMTIVKVERFTFIHFEKTTPKSVMHFELVRYL